MIFEQMHIIIMSGAERAGNKVNHYVQKEHPRLGKYWMPFFVLILEVIFVIDNFFNCVMHDDAKMYK